MKDNIEVAGIPTTAGCTAFAYTPAESAALVARLDPAGAIFIDKQNLDQFATGLVGTRSVGGHCRNAFNAAHVPGGSNYGIGRGGCQRAGGFLDRQ
ncbi:amidase family protein [Burkholderia sp. 3C]